MAARVHRTLPTTSGAGVRTSQSQEPGMTDASRKLLPQANDQGVAHPAQFSQYEPGIPVQTSEGQIQKIAMQASAFDMLGSTHAAQFLRSLYPTDNQDKQNRLSGSRDQAGKAGKEKAVSVDLGVVGVGIMLERDTKDESYFKVAELTEQGSAKASGEVSVGDRVVAVEGISMRGASLSKVLKFILGPVGTYCAIDLEGVEVINGRQVFRNKNIVLKRVVDLKIGENEDVRINESFGLTNSRGLLHFQVNRGEQPENLKKMQDALHKAAMHRARIHKLKEQFAKYLPQPTNIGRAAQQTSLADTPQLETNMVLL